MMDTKSILMIAAAVALIGIDAWLFRTCARAARRPVGSP